VEPDQLPRRSRRLLQLPLHFESFPSKRRKVIIRGTYTSTYQTCDRMRMSTESSQKDTGSPSTPIPTIVNDTPSTPSTTMVVVSEVPIITPVRVFLRLVILSLTQMHKDNLNGNKLCKMR
jgi:hypothetical protein